MPCADPATALSKKWARPTIRNPASSIASSAPRSGPSAWAPSIASSPATRPGLCGPAGEERARGPPRERTSVSAPSERSAVASSCRPARWSARALRLRHVSAGQPRPMASSVTSSDRSSLRSMFRWRGDFVATPNTWSATLPSISRGTSTWPRSPRSEQVPAPEQRVGVEVDDGRGRVDAPRPLGDLVGRRGRDRVQRRSVRATSVRPPARAATAPATAATAAPAATVREPGLTWPFEVEAEDVLAVGDPVGLREPVPEVERLGRSVARFAARVQDIAAGPRPDVVGDRVDRRLAVAPALERRVDQAAARGSTARRCPRPRRASPAGCCR